MTSESLRPALRKEQVPGAARRRPSSSVSGSRVVSLEQSGGSFEKRWRPGGPKFRPNGSLDSRPGGAGSAQPLIAADNPEGSSISRGRAHAPAGKHVVSLDKTGGAVKRSAPHREIVRFLKRRGCVATRKTCFSTALARSSNLRLTSNSLS